MRLLTNSNGAQQIPRRKIPTYRKTHHKMGDGSPSDGVYSPAGDAPKDFKKKLNLFQPSDKINQQQQGGRSVVQQKPADVTADQQKHALSNISTLKQHISEVKNSIDEMKSSSSSSVNYSTSSKASSQIQQSTKSTKTSKSTSSLLKNSGQSSLVKNSNQSNGSATDLTDTSGQLLIQELGDPVSLIPDNTTSLIPDVESGGGFGGSTGSLNSCTKVTKKVMNTSSSSSTRTVTKNTSTSDLSTVGGSSPTPSTLPPLTSTSSSTSSSTVNESTSTCVQQQGADGNTLTYSQYQKTAAGKSKMERDGVTEEKEAALLQEGRKIQAGDDLVHTEGKQTMGATVRTSGNGFRHEKSAVSETEKKETVTPAGTISQDTSKTHRKTSNVTVNPKGGVITAKSSSMSSSESNISIIGFDDFDVGNMQPMDIQNAIMKYSGVMTKFVDQLKSMAPEGFSKAPNLLDHMNDMMKRAWSVPTYGHELGYSLCRTLKLNGGLDILLENCTSDDSKLKFSSAKVLEQCLTTENRGYVVEKGLEEVVNVACDCTQQNAIDQARVGTGILEHLFKHSEGTCSDIIKMGGLEAVVRECRKTDVETLRHCAGALANLSLYGGSENQQAMIQRQVAIWLFPLAFHHDDNIKYYACLAIAALVANTEIEAQVLKADTLSLIEPFVQSHLPEEFANSTVAHRHGQSRDWLERLVPVLSSKREEARNLAAFHFCMEAGIKKNQGNLDIFREINAIEPLKKVASSPNAIASKYAAHALRLMGEEVPHKLSQQVPLWKSNDVQEWVKQIGFSDYADAFVTSRVDGDLLLQITEENLHYDIGITNGILRQRFIRELRRLRQIADYSSKDPTGLNSFLTQFGQEFAEYTYRMLLAGASQHTLKYLSDEQLVTEFNMCNSIHRQRLREGIIVDESSNLQDPNQLDKNLDVFISYRRSNGSQLASLLKVHMQLRGFSVFIDVERLEAGKFDNNLLNSIRQARNFLLVLTPNALDRCNGDSECKDWVHKEIVAALESNCNIIPITDDFHWPDPEQLPEDMRAVCYFNGVRWIHDYQDACVEKLERFMRGEGSTCREPPGSLGRYQSTQQLTQPGTPSPLPRSRPAYHRTTSTESGKGSSCSDKDRD